MSIIGDSSAVLEFARMLPQASHNIVKFFITESTG